MIRKFSLVVFDSRYQITDRINLDLVTEPKGLGFKLDVATIKKNVGEIPTRVSQNYGNINLNVNYAMGREYQKAKALRQWIERNTYKNMALEWINDSGKSFIFCKVVDFDFSEKNITKDVSIPLTIKQLSPFFEVIENEVQIYPSAGGKIYPYEYPYSYGIGVISNNEITNNYIESIPLIITLYGVMENVSVGIRIKGQSTLYGEVAFEGISLQDGQWITINADSNKIIYFNGIEELDGYNYIDASKNSFLYAIKQQVSELTANVQSDKSGRLEARYLKFSL